MNAKSDANFKESQLRRNTFSWAKRLFPRLARENRHQNTKIEMHIEIQSKSFSVDLGTEISENTYQKTRQVWLFPYLGWVKHLGEFFGYVYSEIRVPNTSLKDFDWILTCISIYVFWCRFSNPNLFGPAQTNTNILLQGKEAWCIWKHMNNFLTLECHRRVQSWPFSHIFQYSNERNTFSNTIFFIFYSLLYLPTLLSPLIKNWGKIMALEVHLNLIWGKRV